VNDALYERSKQHLGWKNVEYLGYVPLDIVAIKISKARFGLCLLRLLPNFIESLPVKTFEYMKLGVTPIITQNRYWQDFYKDSAVFVDPNKVSHKDLETVNDDILRDFVNKYCWEDEFNKVAKIYETCAV
jgi:hypothetical protein